jgi:hypothetical protein
MDWQTTGFLRDARSQKRRKFARSIALCYPCSAQAQGNHPWLPVERMRSTHGRICSGPENKCAPRLYGVSENK